jgi:hypothetical protein
VIPHPQGIGHDRQGRIHRWPQPFFVLGLGPAFPAADDEAEESKVELTCGLGLLKMRPLARKLVGR